MRQNHYQVLGISADVSPVVIKQAYRVKAMAAHPDRGGSHEAMLAINEAYEILINPETRRHHDEALANQYNQAAQQQAQADATRAQQHAGQYPREWTEFESWLAKDFSEAIYGNNGMWPTVENSGSGCLFILIGGVVGVFTVILIYSGTGSEEPIGRGIFFGAAGGGFIGQWIHKQIGKSIPKPMVSSRPQPEDDQPTPEADMRSIVSCPKCGQQLRVPSGDVRVRCPSCQFEFNGASPQPPPPSDQTASSSSTGRPYAEKTEREAGSDQNADANMSDDVRQCRLAAEQGDVTAQLKYGIWLARGDGVAMNQTEAVKWYHKAAEQGNSDAQYILSRCYGLGDGINIDVTEAVRWCRKAAEQNHAVAQFVLACGYSAGDGVRKDLSEATRLYRKSAEQGVAPAQYKLGVCYEKGSGLEKDYIQAVQWYRKAAEQDYIDAQINLAICCFDGLGVLQDYSEAVKWYTKAAEGGSVQARFKLGLIFANGKGREDQIKKMDAVAKNDKPPAHATKSLSAWGSSFMEGFKDGCDQSDRRRYEKRLNKALGKNRGPLIGVEYDPIAAYKWMSMAAVQRHEDAVELTAYLATLMTDEQIAEAKRQARIILESDKVTSN